MRFAGALRALARSELRELSRHPSRATLVSLLAAVPVAALVGGSALLATVRPTPEERSAAVLGAAELRIAPRAREAELRELLPANARVERVGTGRERITAHGRRLVARSIACEASGLASGMVRVIEGAAPRARDEAALSPALFDVLGCAVGDRIEVSSGAALVTGIAVDPERLHAPVVLRAAPSDAGDLLVAGVGGAAATLAAQLREKGFDVAARSELGEPDPFEAIALFVIGGFGFFEAALIVAAAFAVSVRRRQRELGLLAANGAGVAELRAAFVVSALVLAGAGIAIGVVVGAASARALHPFLDGWNHRWNGPFELSPLHVGGAVVLAFAATALAAAVPAWSATRLPIRVALSGRRPVAEGAHVWTTLGVALTALGVGVVALGARASGAASAVAILAGSLACVLGLGTCSPWFLGALARIASPLPLAWRLAARDAGRFRARNGPVVTAVLAGMSVCVMFASLASSVEARIRGGPNALADDVLLVDGADAARVAGEIASQLGGLASSAEPAPPGAIDPWLVRLREPVDERSFERARRIATASPGASIDAELMRRAPANRFIAAVLALALGSGLVVVFTATTLSSVESAADARALHTVGAPPGVLSLIGGARAGYLALLGCLLALPAGLVPSAGLVRLANVALEFRAPWGVLALVAFGLPILAFSCAWCASIVRSRAVRAGH